MPKETHRKDLIMGKAAHLDKFFSDDETGREAPDAQDAHEEPDAPMAQDVRTVPDAQKAHEYHRLNVKFRAKVWGPLSDAAWKSRKNVTQYLNDLLQELIDKGEM